MHRDHIHARLAGLTGYQLLILCARLTQMVVRHLPDELTRPGSALREAIGVVDDLEYGGGRKIDLAGLGIRVIQYITANRHGSEADACIPIGDAITYALEVAQDPSLDHAAGAVMAVYAAVELRGCLYMTRRGEFIKLVPVAGTVASPKDPPESASIVGFEQLFDEEVARARAEREITVTGDHATLLTLDDLTALRKAVNGAALLYSEREYAVPAGRTAGTETNWERGIRHAYLSQLSSWRRNSLSHLSPALRAAIPAVPWDRLQVLLSELFADPAAMPQVITDVFPVLIEQGTALLATYSRPSHEA